MEHLLVQGIDVCTLDTIHIEDGAGVLASHTHMLLALQNLGGDFAVAIGVDLLPHQGGDVLDAADIPGKDDLAVEGAAVVHNDLGGVSDGLLDGVALVADGVHHLCVMLFDVLDTADEGHPSAVGIALLAPLHALDEMGDLGAVLLGVDGVKNRSKHDRLTFSDTIAVGCVSLRSVCRNTDKYRIVL